MPKKQKANCVVFIAWHDTGIGTGVGAGAEIGPAPTNLRPVLKASAPAPTRLRPVIYASAPASSEPAPIFYAFYIYSI
jgi:hypothetical protein